jgi:DHA2 family multidrug resistance protein
MAILILLIVGFLLGRGKDARWLMVVGLLLMAVGNYWMAQLNLEVSPWQIIWPRVVLIGGLSMIFAPLNVAAYLYTPKQLRGAAVGLLSLLRNEGGSIGTSLAQTLQERREQFHLVRLGEHLDRFTPAVHSFSEHARTLFLHRTGDATKAQRMVGQLLGNLRQQQASALAYFDTFWLFAVVALLLVLLVFVMKRSVAEKGGSIGAE